MDGYVTLLKPLFVFEYQIKLWNYSSGLSIVLLQDVGRLEVLKLKFNVKIHKPTVIWSAFNPLITKTFYFNFMSKYIVSNSFVAGIETLTPVPV
jgi:hypothetical protein